MPNSTFAWFQTTSTARLNNHAATGDTAVTTATTQHSLGQQAFSNLLNVTVTKTGATLELAHYNAAATGTKKLSTGYLDKSGTFRDLGVDQSNNGKVEVNEHVLYETYTVNVKVKTDLGDTVTDGNSNVYSTAEALKMIRSNALKVTVAPEADSRGRAFISDAEDLKQGENPNFTYDNLLTVETATQNLESLISSAGAIESANSTGINFTWYAYVYGGAGNHSDMNNGSAQTVSSGTFTVNLVDTTAVV